MGTFLKANTMALILVGGIYHDYSNNHMVSKKYIFPI